MRSFKYTGVSLMKDVSSSTALVGRNAAILDAISCARLVTWALLVHDIVSLFFSSLSPYVSRFLLACCPCPTRLVLCRFCPALLFLLFDVNKGLRHNACYSNGAVVAHTQSMLLRKLRLYFTKNVHIRIRYTHTWSIICEVGLCIAP